MGRPRYVWGLIAGAVWVGVCEFVHVALVPLADYRQTWLLLDFGGVPGLCLLAVRLGLYAFAAWGLWRAKPWARVLAMGYLAAELTAFVLVGTGGWRQFVSLHILLVPYATFGFMYLQRGAEDFRC